MRQKELSLVVQALTDPGQMNVNEDSYLVLFEISAPCNTLGMLAVADGMGGRGNGKAASSLAIATLADAFSAACEVSKDKTVASTPDLLRFAFQKANAAVYQSAHERKENARMGTTCTAAVVTDGQIHIAHIGDSRAYLFRNGQLRKLVDDQWNKLAINDDDGQDHTVRTKRRITLVTEAVGWKPIIFPDVITEDLQPDDTIMICTDGLTDEVSETEIEKALDGSDGLQEICSRLVRTASEIGGSDNVTLVLAKLLSTEREKP